MFTVATKLLLGTISKVPGGGKTILIVLCVAAVAFVLVKIYNMGVVAGESKTTLVYQETIIEAQEAAITEKDEAVKKALAAYKASVGVDASLVKDFAKSEANVRRLQRENKKFLATIENPACTELSASTIRLLNQSIQATR
jgi:predicted negative regulator of RcsB-dependent stress response